jgi:hypothetical protein
MNKLDRPALGIRNVLSIAFVLSILGTFTLSLPAQSAGNGPSGGEAADFRVETVPVAGGAEVVTIFARQSTSRGTELPLVSVLRDTLGDDKKENDRLRYVWVLSYTEPSFSQKASAFVPFLYGRTTNKKDIGSGPPPKIADLHPSDRAVWEKVTWVVLKKLILGDFGVGPRASVQQYRQNTADYRRSAVARALAVLSVYESAEGEKILTDEERRDIQARLALDDKLLGWHMASDNLERVYQKEHEKNSDIRNQNWELLRQYSEAQGLYFDPLKMPDGSAHHALVWAAAEDIEANRGRKYDSRFLNIKNPWTDQKLTNWKGYSETRWFDPEGREVERNTPEAKPRTMIPLALYGLDHPKVPALLIDFRDKSNAKRREMSRRALKDVTNNVLSMSSFGNVPYMMGLYLLDFVTDRRGMDINQVSRLRSYSQLKLLLSLDQSLDDEFRAEIAKRVENVSLNPLENDAEVEGRIARKQYENLMAYAARPGGLPAKLARLRREEMVKLVHGPKKRALFKAVHAVTFGLYTHRESGTPELLAQVDTRRQLEFHERRLAEIARDSVKPEVDSNVAALRESLAFISANGSAAKDKTVRLLARVYAITDDPELRDLCVAGLYKIDNSSAKNQLLAIYHDPKTDPRVRDLSARYLKLAVSEGQRVSSRSAADIANIGTN